VWRDIMYIHENSLNRRNRLHRRRSGSKNKIIIVLMVTISFLSVIGTIAAYSPFDHIQIISTHQIIAIVVMIAEDIN
jgi:hypothetical protein